jgi:hypothetical protein
VVSGDLAGPWPDPASGPGGLRMPGANIGPGSENALTIHVLVEGESYALAKKEAKDDILKVRDVIGGLERGINERLSALAGPSGGKVTASDDAPSGRSRLLTVILGGVKDDPQAFAKKIDFGKVHSVSGRVITLVVKKGESPPPAPKSKD